MRTGDTGAKSPAPSRREFWNGRWAWKMEALICPWLGSRRRTSPIRFKRLRLSRITIPATRRAAMKRTRTLHKVLRMCRWRAGTLPQMLRRKRIRRAGWPTTVVESPARSLWRCRSPRRGDRTFSSASLAGDHRLRLHRNNRGAVPARDKLQLRKNSSRAPIISGLSI